MGRATELKVSELLSAQDESIAAKVIAFYADDDLSIITPMLLFSPTADKDRYAQLVSSLEILVEAKLLEDSSFSTCRECEARNSIDAEECGECKTSYADFDEPSVITRQFTKGGDVSRDVRWMILIHGMNSVGSWQQYFSWRISNTYGYAIPVSIFKYGVMRIGVLFKWRISQIADIFETHIKEILAEMEGNGLGPPDVIAHSLGTRILGEVLNRDNNIKLARVILCGSILPQDYDWGGIIGKKIEYVLNHQGGRDFPVRVARFCIAGTGPSGVYGFTDNRVINVKTSSFAHSDFLRDSSLASSLGSGGMWRRFFTSGNPNATFHDVQEKAKFRQGNNRTNTFVRNIIRLLILTLIFIFSVRITQYIILDLSYLIESIYWLLIHWG